MNIEDYKSASYRHLETCIKLKAQIQNTDKDASHNEINNPYIENICYLSGYIIECIVNYGILKHINFDMIKKRKIKQYNNISNFSYEIYNLRTEDNERGVAYSDKEQQNKYAKYFIYRNNHRFFDKSGNNNLYYFKNECGESAKIDELFLYLYKNKQVDFLFKNWSAETRYSINKIIKSSQMNINQNNILEFLEFAQLVHNNLSLHIIPKI